jgi:hypothetical protein
VSSRRSTRPRRRKVPERPSISPATSWAAEHGYLLSHGKFTTIDFPAEGAYGTLCGANNLQGDIVGSYYDSKDLAHAFLLKDRKFKSFDYPGAPYTFAGGISASGVIVGAYYDSDFNEHGFIRKP